MCEFTYLCIFIRMYICIYVYYVCTHVPAACFCARSLACYCCHVARDRLALCMLKLVTCLVAVVDNSYKGVCLAVCLSVCLSACLSVYTGQPP